MKNAMIEASRAPRVSSFALPRLDRSIPTRLEGAGDARSWLARLALAAEQEGFALPGGEAKNVAEILQQQLSDYGNRHMPDVGKHAKLSPVLVYEGLSDYADAQYLSLILGAQSNLNTYRLQPVVEELEKVRKGLGWFVHDALNGASYHGFRIYDDALVAYAGNYMFHEIDEFTDEAMVMAYVAGGGDGEIADPENPTAQEIAFVADQVSIMPSDLLENVGGHEHLLGRTAKGAPKKASARQARQWLQRDGANHPLSGCVKAAITLHALTEKDTERHFTFFNDDECEAAGAVAFVTWNHPQHLYEAAEHYETDLYNSGVSVCECVGRYRLEIDSKTTDDDLRAFARNVKLQLEMWKALDELLSHFTEVEDDGIQS